MTFTILLSWICTASSSSRSSRNNSNGKFSRLSFSVHQLRRWNRHFYLFGIEVFHCWSLLFLATFFIAKKQLLPRLATADIADFGSDTCLFYIFENTINNKFLIGTYFQVCILPPNSSRKSFPIVTYCEKSMMLDLGFLSIDFRYQWPAKINL